MAASTYQAGLLERKKLHTNFPTVDFMIKRFGVRVMHLDSLLLILCRPNGSWEMYTTDKERRIRRTAFSAIGHSCIEHGQLTYFIASRNSPSVELLCHELLTRRAKEAKARLFNES